MCSMNMVFKSDTQEQALFRNELNYTHVASNHEQTVLIGITRHPRFWFDDGNLVLLAQSVAFKVYRGLLAAQSTVFYDLFASATHAEEEYDHCPAVRLTDDPEDWNYLLDFLLPTTYLRISDQCKRQYEQVSALIRLSNKYQLESIELQALEYMKGAFTDVFEQWLNPPQHCVEITHPSQAIEVVRLARLTNNPRMLPLAFYQCALLGEEVLNGLVIDERTVYSEDLTRWISGYRQLCELKRAVPTRLFGHSPSSSCRSRTMCEELLHRLEKKAALVYERPTLLDNIDGWTSSFPLCRMCQRELDARDESRRKELWQKLPEIFMLDDEVKSWKV